MDELRTPRLLLRTPQPDDAASLVSLLRAPEVARWWPRYDGARVWEELISGSDEVTVFIIEAAGSGDVIGAIQFEEENDPEYRHARIDLFVGVPFQRRGLGEEAIRAVVRHLFEDRGHHRIVIDPAAQNDRAIRVYRKVGFRRVGVMRQYERTPDGT